jgi:hypothetical protein
LYRTRVHKLILKDRKPKAIRQTDLTAVVEAGRIFAEPLGDLRLKVDGKEVGRVAVCYCHLFLVFEISLLAVVVASFC